MSLKSIVRFFKYDIWHIKREDLSSPLFFLVNVLRTILLAIRAFTDTRIMRSAAALSFSTMMALVPMVAVVFAIARGFGFSKHIETWFRDLLASQPQVAEVIIGFVNSYLVNVKSGIILGFGLLVMLYTVIMLISNVENTFNDIWNVKNSRGIMRTVLDYVAFFFLLPIVVVVTSGVSIFVTTMSGRMGELVAPMVSMGIKMAPYVIMSLIFIAIYMFMPNTKVKFSSAFWPGILAGVAMQVLQLFYIHSQVWVTSYNAIYGSFAALPLFMLWLQLSWTVCLFGVQLCYTTQNLEHLTLVPYNTRIGQKYQIMLSALLLSMICKRFEQGKKPCTPLELKMESGIPTHIVSNLLYQLERAKLIVDVTGGDKDKMQSYMPAEDIANINLGVMVDRLETVGGWTMDDVDLKQFRSENWVKAFKIRKEYLDRLGEVKVTDLYPC